MRRCASNCIHSTAASKIRNGAPLTTLCSHVRTIRLKILMTACAPGVRRAQEIVAALACAFRRSPPVRGVYRQSGTLCLLPVAVKAIRQAGKSILEEEGFKLMPDTNSVVAIYGTHSQ